MRSSNTGLARGTLGSPQSTLEQETYAATEREAEEVLRGSLVDGSLVHELERSGVRFSRENMEFVTRDATGQIVWLEKGSAAAGLEHILRRHSEDFSRKLNVAAKDIPAYLYRVVRYGTIVENSVVTRGGRKGFSRKYCYNGEEYVLTGVGLNGFIVSAYPN